MREQLEQEEAARIEELDRAHRAKVLLEESLFRGAVEELRRDAVKEFTNCDPKDHLALIAAQQQYIAIENMVNKLLRHIETGTMAKTQLGMIREKLKQWKTGSSRR